MNKENIKKTNEEIYVESYNLFSTNQKEKALSNLMNIKDDSERLIAIFSIFNSKVLISYNEWQKLYSEWQNSFNSIIEQLKPLLLNSINNNFIDKIKSIEYEETTPIYYKDTLIQLLLRFKITLNNNAELSPNIIYLNYFNTPILHNILNIKDNICTYTINEICYNLSDIQNSFKNSVSKLSSQQMDELYNLLN